MIDPKPRCDLDPAILDLDALSDLAQRLGLALVLGCAVAGIYRFTRQRDGGVSTSFMTTLVMLSVLIAVVTQVIGDNQARAFSLVGALAIIRFRTVVEDTRDTAFVIFAVVIGMAAGANYVTAALAGLAAGGLAAVIVRPRTAAGPDAAWNLAVRIGVGHDVDAVLAAAFAKHFAESHLQATTTGRQGAALDLVYRTRLQPGSNPIAIVTELNRVEGVQSVELRRG